MRTITCFGDRTSGTFQIIASVSRTKITRFHGPMTLWMWMFSTALHLLVYSLTGNRNFARTEELIYETIAALTSNSGHLETSSHFHIPLIFCSVLSQLCSIRYCFLYLTPFLILEILKKVRSPWSHCATRTATCFVCSIKLGPVGRGQYLDGWPNTNTPCWPCCNNFFFFFSPSFSKAILRSAELPFLCNAVFFYFQLFVPHFAMAEFMYIQLDTAGHVVRILLNSLDCWSFKTFNNGLNHSKIHTARQFCDFQCLLFLFRQSSMVKPVWAGIL